MSSARRVYVVPIVVAFAASLALAFAAPASAGKAVDRFVGFDAGVWGGQFSFVGAPFNRQSPRGVAVNEGGVGGAGVGDVYVADSGNHRVQVFSAAGVFKFAFGRDVVAEGGVGDAGVLSFEKCVVALDCKEGTVGGAGGEMFEPHAVAVNQATGDVYVRDRRNQRVQQFSATGAFVRAWGWDVVQTGGVGDDSTAPAGEFEVCSVASQCQGGAGGSGVGQFGAFNSAAGFAGTGIAVAPAGSAAAGDVFVVDPQNRRVLRFNADGGLDAVPTIGSSVNFGSSQPLHVAVD